MSFSDLPLIAQCTGSISSFSLLKAKGTRRLMLPVKYSSTAVSYLPSSNECWKRFAKESQLVHTFTVLVLQRCQM